MKPPFASFRKPITAQCGAVAVEFALVVPLFLVLLFGTIEFGRLMYLWNTVQEVSRSAARLAVVTDFTDAEQIACVKLSAVFGKPPPPALCASAAIARLPAAPEVTSELIHISYLKDDGNPVASVNMPSSPGDNIAACLDATRTDSCIRFVEVKICATGECTAINYVPLIGFFAAEAGVLSTLSIPSIPIPVSTVRMPAESLGFSGT